MSEPRVKRKHTIGFFLVGLILGLMARGATHAERLAIAAALYRLASEVRSASTQEVSL